MQGTTASTADEELEGWEAIGYALGVGWRTAMRYRHAKVLKNGNTRPALPVRPNFRRMVTITRGALEQWKAAAALAQEGLLEHVPDLVPAPTTGVAA